MITSGYHLAARYVIHLVGPRYSGRPEDAALLSSAYRTGLELTAEKELKSVAFPSVSTGIYGYPVGEAAQVALRTVRDYLRKNNGIQLVRFVLFDERTVQAYANVLRQL